MTTQTFIPKLTEALTALNHPRMPEKAHWNKVQEGEKYFGPACAVSAHLYLLLMESDEWDDEVARSVIEGIWELHMRGMVAHVEQIDLSEVTSDHWMRYKIRDGCKWYVTELIAA